MDMSRGSKFKDGVRIAAAAYLIYLGMQVISEALKDSSEKKQVLFIIFGVVFIAVGVVIGIWSLKSLVGTVKAEGSADDGDSAQQGSEKADDGDAVEETQGVSGAITQQNSTQTEGITQTEEVPRTEDEDLMQQKETKPEEGRKTESGEHKPSLFDKAGGNISGK
ncbi:MAG: hypothetical protein ACI4ET_05240 [Bilifractor sp.]